MTYQHFEEIRILTLHQPWASLIALGLKQYETRSWSTSYRGMIAIHASKRPLVEMERVNLAKVLQGFKKKPVLSPNFEFPLGAIVSLCILTDCLYMTATASDPGIRRKGVDGNISIYSVSPLEIYCGEWEPGRYAWKLADIKQISPIYCRGKQGLSVVRDASVLSAINQSKFLD